MSTFVGLFLQCAKVHCYILNKVWPGSTISSGREYKSCLGWVFNSKLDCIAILCSKCMARHAATSRVENSALDLSCQLKFVHGLAIYFFLSTIFKSTKHCIFWIFMKIASVIVTWIQYFYSMLHYTEVNFIIFLQKYGFFISCKV